MPGVTLRSQRRCSNMSVCKTRETTDVRRVHRLEVHARLGDLDVAIGHEVLDGLDDLLERRRLLTWPRTWWCAVRKRVSLACARGGGVCAARGLAARRRVAGERQRVAPARSVSLQRISTTGPPRQIAAAGRRGAVCMWHASQQVQRALKCHAGLTQ